MFASKNDNSVFLFSLIKISPPTVNIFSSITSISEGNEHFTFVISYSFRHSAKLELYWLTWPESGVP